MIKNVTQFKSVIQGIESTFHFDQSCPIEVAKSALLECLKWLGQIEDAIKAQAEAQKPATEQPKEETNGEPTNGPEASV